MSVGSPRHHAARAKNVILFVGDGMGVTTVTAARILDGQLRGEHGEENELFFETFPYYRKASFVRQKSYLKTERMR